MRPQVPGLFRRELKREIGRETFLISFYLLVQAFGRYAINPREVRVEDHFFTTDFFDKRLNFLERFFR